MATSIIGLVTAEELEPAWKELPMAEGSFTDVMFSADGSMVFAGGNQLTVRSWDGTTRWGGRAGTVAGMSADGNYVFSAAGELVQVLDRNGTIYWIRAMGTPVRAVAISSNASLVVTADERGDIHAWTGNGESIALNRSDRVKSIAISPSQSLVVVTTVAGLKYLSRDMTPLWYDNKSGSLDSFIAISQDGTTVISAGENRVSSHTVSGSLNWMKDVPRERIIDMASSSDCSTIVLGSQDGGIWALDRTGKVLWTYSTGSWVNGVDVSRDGSLIAAGTLSGDLYLLNHYGDILVKKKIQGNIQERSVALNGAGDRVVFADQYSLNGYDITGESGRDRDTSPALPAISPVRSYTPSAPVMTQSVSQTRQPEGTERETPRSPSDPTIIVLATAGIFLAIGRHGA